MSPETQKYRELLAYVTLSLHLDIRDYCLFASHSEIVPFIYPLDFLLSELQFKPLFPLFDFDLLNLVQHQAFNIFVLGDFVPLFAARLIANNMLFAFSWIARLININLYFFLFNLRQFSGRKAFWGGYLPWKLRSQFDFAAVVRSESDE